MSRPLALRRFGAALALPLVLAMTSCADEEAESSEASSSDSRTAPTTDEDSEAVNKNGEQSTPGTDGDDDAAPQIDAEEGDAVSAEDFTGLMEAAFDKATTAHITMTSGGKKGVSAKGEVDYTTKTPSIQLAMSGGGAGVGEGEKIDVRLVGGAMYMNMGSMSGGKFAKFPIGDASNSPMDPAQLDPSQTLKHFEKAAEKIIYRGEEKVQGEDFDRFSLVLDPGKMGNYDASQLKTLPKKISYDVWLDNSGHFRQLSMDMGKLGVTTMKYSDWGKPVKITAPPADQVIETPKLPDSPGGA